MQLFLPGVLLLLLLQFFGSMLPPVLVTVLYVVGIALVVVGSYSMVMGVVTSS